VYRVPHVLCAQGSIEYTSHLSTITSSHHFVLFLSFLALPSISNTVSTPSESQKNVKRKSKDVVDNKQAMKTLKDEGKRKRIPSIRLRRPHPKNTTHKGFQAGFGGAPRMKAMDGMECYLATSVFLFFFVGGRRHTRLMSFFVFVLQRVIRFEQSVGSAIDSANSSSPDHSMDLSLFFATSERTRYGQLLGFLVLGRGSIFFLTGNGHWQECIHVHILLGFRWSSRPSDDTVTK
jgi:hypothetical protein